MRTSSIALTSLMLVFAAFLDISTAVGASETMPSWLLARHRKPIKLTTKIPLSNKETIIASTLETQSGEKEETREYYSTYHPAAVAKPRLIERYDKRTLDGAYEYRYVLSNGDIRYERAYWQTVGDTKALARVGFYSYPLPNHKFHTVFYTADHNGFLEAESTISRTQPNLPRSLEIPPQTDVGNEKSEGEKKGEKGKNRANRKLNWSPVTTASLQTGRKAQEINPATVMERGVGATEATASETSTGIITTLKTSAPNVTNRPQINAGASNGAPGAEPELAINPVKAGTEQTAATAAIATETAQLDAIDTATVLSVD